MVRGAVDNSLRQVVTLRETSREFGDYASTRQVNRKPLDLRRLLDDLAAGYSESRERGFDFEARIAPSMPATFHGDERLLRGAVANLIENAFQAAPGGRVRLGAEGVDSKVLISVEDRASIGAAAESSGAAALIRKQQFGPAMLRKLWARHGPSRKAAP